MKPREFKIHFIDEGYRGYALVSGMHQEQVLPFIRNQKVTLHVREVVPIDWDKIWRELFYTYQEFGEIDPDHKPIIQKLVEDSIKGELIEDADEIIAELNKKANEGKL